LVRSSSACRSPRRGRSGPACRWSPSIIWPVTIESLVLQNGELPLPSVVLVVSGGHTNLYLVDRPVAISSQPDAR